jgi:serine/threonine protein kinase
MGAVYEVVDRNTRRRRALKVMLPLLVEDAELRERFRLEAAITAEIESPHLVETLDADVDAETNTPFVVLELLKGEDLGATLARRGKLPPGEALELLHQAALGLDRTHAVGVVHRDLKPSNLFVTTSDDGSVRLRVLDFGIAKIVQSGPPLTTRALGTPLFMPPEQTRRRGPPRARARGSASGRSVAPAKAASAPAGRRRPARARSRVPRPPAGRVKKEGPSQGQPIGGAGCARRQAPMARSGSGRTPAPSKTHDGRNRHGLEGTFTPPSCAPEDAPGNVSSAFLCTA